MASRGAAPRRVFVGGDDVSFEAELPREELDCVVLDCGSGAVKAGFSGSEAPEVSFPTIIGTSRNPTIMVGMGQKDYYVGNEAERKRGILMIDRNRVVENGVGNFELQILSTGGARTSNMEKLWHHTFYNELRVAPEENFVMMTEALHNPRENREKTCEIMFESFNVPYFALHQDARMALVARGENSDHTLTGLVVHVGHHQAFVAAYVDGDLAAPPRNCPVNGALLTDYLMSLLNEEGARGGGDLRFTLNSREERGIVRDIKERLSYIAADYEQEVMAAPDQERYELPDGQEIVFSNELFQCSELLMRPSLIGNGQGLKSPLHDFEGRDRADPLPWQDSQGIGGCAVAVAQAFDAPTRDRLLANVVLAGHVARTPGFARAIQRELRASFGAGVPPVISETTGNAVWEGAALLSSTRNAELGAWRREWMNKDEFGEHGAALIHQKFAPAVDLCNAASGPMIKAARA